MIASAVRNSHGHAHAHGHDHNHPHAHQENRAEQLAHKLNDKKVIPENVKPDHSFSKKKRRLSVGNGADFGFKATTVAREVYGERGSISAENQQIITSVSFKQSYRMYGLLFWKVEPAALGGFEDTPFGIIHPQSKFVGVWSAFMMFFIVMCCLYVPYQVAFDYEESFDGSSSAFFWKVLSSIMDVYFMIDLFLNFRIGYIDDGELVVKKWDIFVRYWKSWFFIDFFSSVSTVLQILASTPALSMLRNLRVLRLLRLLKLLRAVKINKVIESFDGISHELRAIVQMCKIFLYVVGVTHLLGCGFYAISVISPEKNWVVDYYDGKEDWGCGSEDRQCNGVPCSDVEVYDPLSCVQVNAGAYSIYLTGLYWAFVTVTTVGYGDICPTNDDERLYVMFCTFIGTAVFAFTVGEITAMASQSHVSDIAYAEQMAAMEEFLRRRALPKEMRKAIRKSYETNWERCISFNDSEIIERLSYSLRKNVQLYLKKSIIEKIPFFKHAGDELTYKLCASLLPLTVNIGEDIVIAGEEGHEMYIVDKGEVEVLDEVTQAPLIRLGEGSFFGEIALLQEGSIRTKTVRACQLCELYSLNKLHFDEVLRAHPEFKEHCLKTARARLTRQASMTTLNLGKQQEDVLKNFNQHLEKEYTETDESGDHAAGDWKVGDRVRITKEGKQKGQAAIVTDPDWTGRVKVELEKGKAVKSYLSSEIVQMAKHSWKVGDEVQVTKAGTHNGKTAVVSDTEWDAAGGRVKVKMDSDGSTKSYLSGEIRAIISDPSVMARRKSVSMMMCGQAGSAMALPMSPAYFLEEGKDGEESKDSSDVQGNSGGAGAGATPDAATGSTAASSGDEESTSKPAQPESLKITKPPLNPAQAVMNGANAERRSSVGLTNSPMIFQRRALARPGGSRLGPDASSVSSVAQPGSRQSTPRDDAEESAPADEAESPRQKAFKEKMEKANLPPLRGSLGGGNAGSLVDEGRSSPSGSPTKKDESSSKSMKAMKKDLQQLVASHTSLEKLVTDQVARQDQLSTQLELLLQVLAKDSAPQYSQLDV